MKTIDMKYACGIASFLILLYPQKNRKIVETILDNEGIQSTDLLKKSGLKPSTFHKITDQLEAKRIIQKVPQKNRTVTYHMTPFSKAFLAVSKEMLQKIEKDVGRQVIHN